MLNKMLDKVLNILHQQCSIEAKNRLLIGVSGGPDSLSLLYLLRQTGYPTIAMHVNHGLRPEADAEAQGVERFAASLGIEFISSKVDVRSYSRQQSVSIEEAARILRYQALFEAAKQHRVRAVVVGHTADDQVETILMHLLRGTGLSGLRGMEFHMLPNPWSKKIPLLRPFLSTWRAEIEQYALANGLQPTLDKSNLDLTYFRNRIRHELLPFLEKYNPSIRMSLWRMGESLKDDYATLQHLVDLAWGSTLVKQGKGYIEFRTAVLLQLPRSVQRLLLRQAIAYHLPDLKDVSFDCIERGLMLLTGDIPGKQTDLIAGLRMQKEADRFLLFTDAADLAVGDYPIITPGEKIALTIPSTLELANGWQLETEEIKDFDDIQLRSQANPDPYQAWLDASKVVGPLSARARQPGDYIRSLGLDGHATKISDLMINLKLPKRARATWPLICSGEEILWVPGYRLSHLVRIRPETSKAIHLRLIRRQVP